MAESFSAEDVSLAALAGADGDSNEFLLQLARLLYENGLIQSQGHLTYEPSLAPPASKEAVKALPSKTIPSNQEVQCTICLKYFKANTEVTEMPCHHQFHSPCILPWLKRTNSCPVCRFELATDSPQYEALRAERRRDKERELDLETLHQSMYS